MTPLNLHIPTEEFRSVFHLREIRSVHDEPFLGDVPEETFLNFDLSSHAMLFTTKQNASKVIKGNQKRFSYGIGKETERELVPTMIRQTNNLATQNFLLDWSHQDPMKMKYYMMENLYDNFVTTLGIKKVKSHFRRRGNKLPFKKLSYSDITSEDFSKFYSES